MSDLLRVLAVFALVAANAFQVTAEYAVAGSESRKTRDDESFGCR